MLTIISDASASLTLSREMLEAIEHKFPNITHDDAHWPQITPNGSHDPSTRPVLRARFDLDLSGDSSDEDDDGHEGCMKSYWEFIANKYRAHMYDQSALSTPSVDLLPLNWTVISITLTSDHKTLFVTRQRPRQEPLIFCVPLNDRRETEDEDAQKLTYEDVMNEFKEIIASSDQGTRDAVNVDKNDKRARAEWWAKRTELDERLKTLLENIEFCWLGAFKVRIFVFLPSSLSLTREPQTIFSDPPSYTREALLTFRHRLEKIFKRTLLVPQDRKTQKACNEVRLSDALLECFSTLSPSSSSEELEDLAYFIMDLYQFHGVPVATAEVDIDHVVVDIRSALDELNNFTGKAKPIGSTNSDDPHLFLVLDKNVQCLPWESIPILRGRSISRIPSIEFLTDRVSYARQQKGLSLDLDLDHPLDRVTVDPRKTFVILNPSSDLKNTEARFAPWVHEMKSEAGWESIIGRSPSEQQLVDAFTRKDLVMSVTCRFLFLTKSDILCSSDTLDMGEPSSTFAHIEFAIYLDVQPPCCGAVLPVTFEIWETLIVSVRLTAICWLDGEGSLFSRLSILSLNAFIISPTLVANLWDVTDRDIDKFSQSVFDKLQLTADRVRDWRKDSSKTGVTSIVAALARSRDSCKLKYLTGAAPIVYGIPFYL